jgi:hypothetical protein
MQIRRLVCLTDGHRKKWENQETAMAFLFDGRDVIDVKKGVGSVRFLDSGKRYGPGHVVTADDVRALLGVLHGDLNATKGIITTSSDFAPNLLQDAGIAAQVPYRLEWDRIGQTALRAAATAIQGERAESRCDARHPDSTLNQFIQG